MDSSSNSQHSDHPVSGGQDSDDSGSRTYSGSISGGQDSHESGSRTYSGSLSGGQDSHDSGSMTHSGSKTHSGSGGSTGEASLSTNSSMNTNTYSGSGDQQEEQDDAMDVDMTTSDSTKPSTGKDKEVVVDPAAAASSSSSSTTREGKAEEIGLLTDLYTLHNKTGRYAFSGINDKRDFYKFWIQEEREYTNKEELDKKINELHARFLKNMDKNVEGPTDPVDVEILRLSHWIWGHEIDSSDQGTSNDDQED